MHLANARDEFVAELIRDQVGHGASLQSAKNVFITLVGREHDNSRLREFPPDRLDSLGAGHLRRQVHIHDGYVGTVRAEQIQSILSARSCRHNLHIRLGSDRRREPPAYYGMIVYQQNANSGLPRRLHTYAVEAMGTMTSMLVPWPGSLKILNSPPTFSAR